ncbi:MAG: CpXC domain-containing protein [Dialister sp.]|nr:CpXC domain-containing protein [Dialister sp.]
MSKWRYHDVACPFCGRETKWKLWDYIYIGDEPAMKAAVRDHSAFYFRCSHCEKETYLHYSFLYQEDETKLLIYVCPDGSDYGEMQKKMTSKASFLYRDYERRIVLSYNDFLEKLLIADAGLDDRVIEIIKALLWQQLLTNYPKQNIEEIRFMTNQSGWEGFIVKTAEAKEATADLNETVYNGLTAVLRRNKPEDALIIDRAWAYRFAKRLHH